MIWPSSFLENQHKWPATRIITWPLCVPRQRQLGWEMDGYLGQPSNQPTNGIDECKGRVEASIKQPVHPSRIPLNGWLSAKAGSGIRLDSRGRRRLPRKQLFLGAIQKLCITLKVVFAEMRSAPLYSVFSSFYARDIELFKCRTSSTRNGHSGRGGLGLGWAGEEECCSFLFSA